MSFFYYFDFSINDKIMMIKEGVFLFKFNTFKPNSKLEKWIKSYWIIDYQKKSLDKHQKEKVIIPYDNVCLMFIINPSSNKIDFFGTPIKSGIYIAPPSMNVNKIIFDKDIYYIDISLYPGVFTKLFNIPIYELEDRLYDVKELSLKFDLTILETLYNLKDNSFATVNQLDQYLFDIFKDMEEDRVLSNLLVLSKDHNLDNFYKQNVLSTRQIQRKVKDLTGITPKSIERISRFYDTLKIIKSNENNIDFKNIAIESNFYDQSSFIKEFKFFTGVTPTLFLLHAEDFLQYRCNIFC